MNTFLLKISSPDGDLFCDKVASIVLRGTEGEFAIMADHIPFVTTIKPCEFKIQLEDDTIKEGKTDGGILTVSKEVVTFLSGSVSLRD